MKILIADDSLFLKERLVAMIKSSELDTEIHQAINTLEAKEKIRNERFDVVISDIKMPGGGGIKLLEFIKKEYQETVTIIITNYPYPQYKTKAQDLGAEYFLSKFDELEKLNDILTEIQYQKQSRKSDSGETEKKVKKINNARKTNSEITNLAKK